MSDHFVSAVLYQVEMFRIGRMLFVSPFRIEAKSFRIASDLFVSDRIISIWLFCINQGHFISGRTICFIIFVSDEIILYRHFVSIKFVLYHHWLYTSIGTEKLYHRANCAYEKKHTLIIGDLKSRFVNLISPDQVDCI